MANMALRSLGGITTCKAFVSGSKCAGVVSRGLRPVDVAWQRRLQQHLVHRWNHQVPGGSAAAMVQPSGGSSREQDLDPLGVVTKTSETGEIVETVYVEGVSLTPESFPSAPVPGGLGPNADPFLATSGSYGMASDEMPPGPGETIGQALEAAAVQRGDKELTTADARAVQSAEARATGFQNVKGGPASVAQALADKGVPLGDVLRDATDRLPTDKVVTQEDASAVQAAEQRNNQGRTEAKGVAASVQQAANFNKAIGAA